MQLITDEIRTALIANGRRSNAIQTSIRFRSSNCSRPTRPLRLIAAAEPGDSDLLDTQVAGQVGQVRAGRFQLERLAGPRLPGSRRWPSRS
jgi:hypothetical protein